MTKVVVLIVVALILVIMVSVISRKDIKIPVKDETKGSGVNETGTAAVETVKVKTEETAENKVVKEAAVTETGADKKTAVDIILKDPGKNKVMAVKIIHDFTRFDLKTSKALMESPSSVIKKGVPKKDAEDFKSKIEANGGIVELL